MGPHVEKNMLAASSTKPSKEVFGQLPKVTGKPAFPKEESHNKGTIDSCRTWRQK